MLGALTLALSADGRILAGGIFTEFAGQTTASPWETRLRSSPTWTQPPPLTTMNSEVLRLACGVMTPCFENASSETCPRSSLQMT